MRLAQRAGPIDGREARASRVFNPDKLHKELAQAIDDHDSYREQQARHGARLEPDIAIMYGSLADAAASRAQDLSDQITAATGKSPLVVVNDWGPKNNNRRVY